MIVDVHTHVGVRLTERDKKFFVGVPGYTDYLRSFTDGMSFEKYWEAMHTVDKAIIVNGRYDPDQPKSLNDEVAKIAETHSEKLIAFCSVMPDEESPAREVRRCVNELGMRGVKLYPVLQRYPPNHRKYYPIYDVAQEMGVPVVFHMGTHFFPDCRLEYTKPLLLEEVALDFPNLKILCAHLGHPWVEDCIMLVRKAPNVYADISGLMLPGGKRTFSVVYRGLVLAYEYGALDKILFGSDYPINTPGNCIEILKNINHFTKNTDLPKIPDEAIRNILEENWKNIIKI